MDRKKLFARVGFGVAALLVPSCIAGLATSCNKDSHVNTTSTPTVVDFKLNIASGEVSKNDGHLFSNGIIVAKTNDGGFLAVSAACTHKGAIVD
jgi:cytochrome b6-f complex iron-sulfur subunit